MAKSTELRVEIDPDLLERLRKQAKHVGVRLPSLVEIALVDFLERRENVTALLRRIDETLAGQDIVNAKIEHLAEFVAAALAPAKPKFVTQSPVLTRAPGD